MGSFMTSKGSIYHMYSNGSTRRIKSGSVQPVSQKTVYVDPKDLCKLAAFQTSGSLKQIAPQSKTSLGVRYLSGPLKGTFNPSTIINFKQEPAIGLSPIEIWKDGIEVHFGHDIIAIA